MKTPGTVRSLVLEHCGKDDRSLVFNRTPRERRSLLTPILSVRTPGTTILSKNLGFSCRRHNTILDRALSTIIIIIIRNF